jgi:polyisoprenoid-binding protein YceI
MRSWSQDMRRALPSGFDMPTIKKVMFVVVLVTAVAAAAAQPAAIDTGHSTVTVRVYKTGLFSGLAHNHIVKAPIASGTVDTMQRTVAISFNAEDLKIADTEGSESEHQEIEATMKGPKVLDVAQFPVISFASKRIEMADSKTYRVVGDLKLHGASREITMPVVFTDGSYKGSVMLKQTDFGITPVKIAGGTVRVKDEIEISFEIRTR